MQATVTRPLGATAPPLPNADAGTISGKPAASFRNRRLLWMVMPRSLLGGAGRGVRRQIAQRELNAGQKMLQNPRLPEVAGGMAQHAVKYAPLAVFANPTDRVVAIRPRAAGAGLHRVGGHGEQDVQLLTRIRRRGEAEELVHPRKWFRVDSLNQRALRVVHMDGHLLVVGGVRPAVGTQHLAELGPIQRSPPGSVIADQPA